MTRFCNYCRTNGHTPSWCRKKIRDEELKRIENERTAEKKVTFTQDYNKKRGPDHGLEQWTRGKDFQRRNQNFTNVRFRGTSSIAYQNFFPGPNSACEINNPNNWKIVRSTLKSVIQQKRWKSISKRIFQHLEWELAKPWKFFSFSIDSKKRLLTI